MTDKMREEFEAWYRREAGWHGSDTERDGLEYTDGNVQLAFDAWCGSRAALVVELLHFAYSMFPSKHECHAAVEAVKQCKRSIESAGVTVK